MSLSAAPRFLPANGSYVRNVNRDKADKPSAATSATGECYGTRHPEEPFSGVQDG